MEKIISLCKRRGFIYPSSEIYGGLSGFWDYGPLGLALKNNLKNLWWKIFVDGREDMFGIETSVIMNPKVWQSSGHVSGFADTTAEGKKFNVMFETKVGAGEEAVVSYLRPETAQGMFVNFKNIIDSFHPRLPFGIAQIGKAFRNEIAPRDFLFRAREFEQMEIEYFIPEGDWKQSFEYWREEMLKWIKLLNLNNVHEKEVNEEERAHYSKRTIDFEYDFPFGRSELYGLAYRTDFDLRAHQEGSGQNLEYYDEETKERFLPHVIEPTFGLDRSVLAVLSESYSEDKMDGESRIYLKLPKALSPIKVAVFPLLKNKPELVKKAREVYESIRSMFHASGFKILFDDNGNIGKRYRRQDEIGTPHCITIDFETLENDTVTVRDRDTGKQERVAIKNLFKKLQ